MKKVSIIVPVYNLEKNIELCVETLLNQTYLNIEILLIDDGSNDKSYTICKELDKKNEKVLLVHHENHGVSYTRNQGLIYATGDYIMFVDGDDLVLSDMVEKYVAVAERYQADVVLGGIMFSYENGKKKEKKFRSETKFGAEIWEKICRDETGLYGYISNKLYRTKVIKDNNIFFDVNKYAQEDLDFALSVYEKCNCFCTINYTGYIYKYVENKRKHPLDQFIANKIKMLKIAENKYEISEFSKRKIENQIEQYIYIMLYESKYREMRTNIKRIHEIEGIHEILHIDKSTGIVIKLFQKRFVILLDLYFWVRKKIGCLRKIIRRGMGNEKDKCNCTSV